MRSKSFAERIADVLIEDGLLLPSQLEEAVGLQQKEGGRLLKILTDRQFVTDQDMTVSMGRCLNTPLINLAKLRVPEEIMSLVPREMARTFGDSERVSGTEVAVGDGSVCSLLAAVATAKALPVSACSRRARASAAGAAAASSARARTRSAIFCALWASMGAVVVT